MSNYTITFEVQANTLKEAIEKTKKTEPIEITKEEKVQRKKIGFNSK